MNYLALIVFILICQAAGMIGNAFTVDALASWYVYLKKPFFNPPGWLFGAVWAILYTLMGLAAYDIWQQGMENGRVKSALVILVLNLILNILWSVFFFTLKNPGLALGEIVILWAVAVMLAIRFYLLLPLAGYLLIPYVLWLSFAVILNFFIWILNR